MLLQPKSLSSIKIDGLLDDELISEFCRTKFSSTTGSTNVSTGEYIHNLISPRKRSSLITKPSLENLVKKLKPGLGFDGIHAYHVKHLDSHILIYIMKFLNMCLTVA